MSRFTPPTASASHQSAPRPVTMRDLRRRVKAKEKFAMLTCYDATTARWLYRGGVDVMLVGDTAGSMVLGFEDTIHAPLQFMLTITAAVKRGAPNAFVMGDMPFMSYQADEWEAVKNAGRFMTEGMADAVKVEVDERFVGLIEKLDRASIPVVAHIGWRPQRTPTTGVPIVAGRTQDKIKKMVKLAKKLEDAGAVMLLIEQSTAEAARAVIDAVNIPVIGCGAGPDCHGHVVVLHDWLGMTDWQPSFAPPAANGGKALQDMGERWVELVKSGNYLKDGGPYEMKEG
ncbi:3-methyl-2-oxobutanoate hydroxymethyltransferase [Algisphaera agarilytica]|uniref:3-methyl-2-oxobutanoate hydroxymethyltransferase n=1 Tax=Algisphaera agarilytica TaxID=1385975 RepID=A0A7X0H713_9BACT|nr:3-methyl-2-oxobutanoate hydroxymethyltransferase [Algisphaera agarilytica]MBB6430288.1 3-methyl-2-oxobutanoate hydroxymethyltransferase [Algisphaera agarilytica]